MVSKKVKYFEQTHTCWVYQKSKATLNFIYSSNFPFEFYLTSCAIEKELYEKDEQIEEHLRSKEQLKEQFEKSKLERAVE